MANTIETPKRKGTGAIIIETAEFYKLGNRGLSNIGGCTYLGVNGRKCAVGRCMTEEGVYRADALNLGSVKYDSRMRLELEDLLEEEYKGHSMIFWEDLQYFHDHQEFWTEEGLSEKGKEQYKYLLARWSTPD